MKAFSWFSDMFKSRKDEEQDSGPVMEVGNVPNWEPVMEIPDIREDDYERTVPVFDIPEWDPNVPEFAPPVPHEPVMPWGEDAVMEIPAQISAAPAEDYERTSAVFETPKWEPEEIPASVVPMVHWPEPEDPDPEEIRMAALPVTNWAQPEVPVDDGERTAAAFEVPEWEPDVPEIEPVVQWPEPEKAVTEIPARIPEMPAEDYERTVAVFDIPEWEPDVPEVPPVVHRSEPEEVVTEIPALVPAAPAEDYERTSPILEMPSWEPEELPTSVVPIVHWPEPEDPDPEEIRMAVLPEREPVQPEIPEEDYERTVPSFAAVEPEPEIPPLPEEVPTAAAPEDDYERTVAVFDIPEWEPEVPEPVVHRSEPEEIVTEIPALVPAVPAEDYQRTSAVFEAPKWEPEEIPTSAVPMVHWPEPEDPDPEEIRMAVLPESSPVQPEVSEEDYERTVPSFAIPEWEPEQPGEDAVVEIPAQIPAAPVDDYERTVPVFEVPEWEPEPLRTEPAIAVPEIAAEPDPEKTVFSGAVRQMAPAVLPEEEVTRPVAAEKPEQKCAEPEEPWPITGKDTLYPPDYVEAEEKPVPREPEVVILPVQKAEPVKAAPPVVKQPEPVKAAPPVEVKRPEPPVSVSRRATSIPVKPKPATPTVVDMKTPEVPDFGRSISSEICDFSVRQQWNWLGKLHDVIPTLRMGTEPACVDYPLTLRNMQAAGDMRITVRRVAMGVGTILSITNLENAITCEDTAKLREASQILTAYGKMVSGRQADAIRMTVRYLGVRVAELQMR